MKPRFFATPSHLREWFEKNHAKVEELWVGYYKKDSGRASVTWPESVDEALCVGWIDGIRKSIDAKSYEIRFTPRRPGSIWSAINIKRCRVLGKEGRMREAGLKAFASRSKAHLDGALDFRLHNGENQSTQGLCGELFLRLRRVSFRPDGQAG